MFSQGLDSGQAPMEFVNDMRKKGQLIMGIGHRVKSVSRENIVSLKKAVYIMSKGVGRGTELLHFALLFRSYCYCVHKFYISTCMS